MTDGQEKFEIDEIMKHPAYEVIDNVIEMNDVALIRLGRPAQFGPSIDHVCLPDKPGLQ
jgi:hypothetical protein